MASETQIPEALWHINEGPHIIRVHTSMIIVATVIVSLRLALRLSRRTGVGQDDWLIAISLILLWAGFSIPVLLVNQGGLGRPLIVNMAIDPNRLSAVLKLIFAGEFVYAFQILSIKLVILAMYWRIFPTRFMKLGCAALAWTTGAWCLAVVLVSLFQCRPIAKVYDPSITTGHCLDNTKFFIGNAVPNIFTDILILCLPLYEIKKLKLPKGQRAMLSSIFLLGAGVVAVSAVRLYYSISLAQEGTSADLTMSMVHPVLWTTVEPDIAIICASLPVMRPLITELLNLRFVRSINSYMSKARGGQDTAAPSQQPAGPAMHTIGGTSRYKKAPPGSQDTWDGVPSTTSSFTLLRDEESELGAQHGEIERNHAGAQSTWWYPNRYPPEQTSTVRCGQGTADEVQLGSIKVERVLHVMSSRDPSLRENQTAWPVQNMHSMDMNSWGHNRN